MNKLKYIFMTLLASAALMSCDGDDPEPAPTPAKGKRYTQTCDMPAKATESIVTLYSFKTAITSFNNPSSWISIIRQVYDSGSPQVLVSVTENLQADPRQQDVTFIAENDTLILTVRQAAYSGMEGVDMENLHDTKTDQPAYMPQK